MQDSSQSSRDDEGAEGLPTPPPEPPLHRAARLGDIAELERLLASGADINQRADVEIWRHPNHTGLTPLMVAARSWDGATAETLRWLVEKGADTRLRSAGSLSAAWYAAGLGERLPEEGMRSPSTQVDKLRYLLDTGFDPNEQNRFGDSLLSEACTAGDTERVHMLLERGAAVTTAKPSIQSKQTLHNRLLANLRSKSPGQESPKSDLAPSAIPIFCAAASGNAGCVRILLNAGANPDERDNRAMTPLMFSGSAEVVRVLLDAGADLNARDDFDADVLDRALDEQCCGVLCSPVRREVARALVDRGADVELTKGHGWTRLHHAAFSHKLDAVKFLIEAGADPLHRDSSGETALHRICWQGEYEDPETNQACQSIIESLVAAGVDPNVRADDGKSPLHEAVFGDWGNPTAVRTLLKLGADPNATDQNGVTPLMEAAYQGGLESVRLLLEAGADPHRRDKDNSTSLEYANDLLKICRSNYNSLVANELDANPNEQHKTLKEQPSADAGVEDSKDADGHDSNVTMPNMNAVYAKSIADTLSIIELLTDAMQRT